MALFLLWNLVLGLQRTLTGPTTADRLASVQLFTTKSVAILLLLSYASDMPALRDVALVFVLLAIITVLAFVGVIENP